MASSFQRMRGDLEAEPDDVRRKQLASVLAFLEDNYREMWIGHGVIRSGGRWIQEFSLTQATVEGGVLEGMALWHEDAADPGDASHVRIRLVLEGDRLEFAFVNEDGQPDEPIVFVPASSEE